MAVARTYLLCFVLSISSAMASATPTLKIMSFNIRFDGAAGQVSDKPNAWLSTSGAHRRDLALQVIRETDPDLLCVQEALASQLEDFQAELDGHGFYGVGRDNGEVAGEHCGIFYRGTRFDAVDQGTFWLNENSDLPGSKFPQTCCARIASWLILRDSDAGGREFLLLNTHWDHQIQEAREFSAKLIRRQLATLAGKRPVIVAGDLNATTDNPAFQTLVHSQEGVNLRDAYREAHTEPQENEGTYHGFRGNLNGNRIDYVLYGQGFRIASSEIIRNHYEHRYPSDHFPVTAVLMPVD